VRSLVRVHLTSVSARGVEARTELSDQAVMGGRPARPASGPLFGDEDPPCRLVPRPSGCGWTAPVMGW